VYFPKHFRPQSLSRTVKQQLSQRADSDAMLPWLTHSPDDEKHYRQFQKEIAKQDSMKNISMRDYLPELAELLKW
jgi:hypothetical protein